MESRANKTPYNSIYEPIRKAVPQKTAPELCCCLHGAQCSVARTLTLSDATKVGEEQYVNLLPSKEEKMASQLTSKLNKLAIDEKTKKNIDTVKDQKPVVSKPIAQKVIDTDQSYVRLGSTSDDQSAYSRLPPITMTSVIPSTATSTESSFSKVSTKSTTTDSAVSDNFRSCAASIYLGVMSKTQAEQKIANPTEFALYHCFMNNAKLDKITDGLPLILVYKTSSNLLRHYPVRTTTSGGGDVQYYVDYGRANVRKHWSLNQLVKYYQTHVSFRPNCEEADIFSSWSD